RARPRELAPRFGAQAGGVVAEAVQQRERVRVDRALGLAAGREGAELSGAEPGESRLGEDRARRVAGTEKQRVEDVLAGRRRTCGNRLALRRHRTIFASTVIRFKDY